MRRLTAIAVTLGVLVVVVGQTAATPVPSGAALSVSARPTTIPADALNEVVKRYCQRCHSDTQRRGNLTLTPFDVAAAPRMADVAEKVVAKLRSGMMPPPGSTRPAADTLDALVATLESQLDAAATADPNPGRRTFQRLNRAEYTAAIRDLLSLEIDAGAYLPLDTKSDNFDNIADVQVLSPTLLDAYLRAASEISWLAVGNPKATASSATYTVPRTASQTEHVEGAPFGTRGGVSVMHTFPSDGAYTFKVFFYHETTGAFAGGNARGEQIEISIDGQRAGLLDIDRFMTASDPNGVSMATEPIRVTAGPHRVSAAFIPPAFQGVVQDLISPLKWSLASTSNATAYGFSLLPHLRDLVITGPTNPSGVSDSPVRRRIFSCRPSGGTDGRACARSIVTRLATAAYRRPLTAGDVNGLMAFYDQGLTKDGFDGGVRTALEAILASPDFVFRFERAPARVKPGETYRLADIDLASRLAFFLWSGPPDHELLTLAGQGRLSDDAVLEREVRRMMRDPRAATLATRFAAQWLRLQDLDKVKPDPNLYPNFADNIAGDMVRETEIFFEHLVREDRSVLDLFTADYTFVNERLARHYGIANVAGPEFRRVSVADPRRRGVLGQASVLTLTSHATRTSPVDRGKWVMEVFLNSPPPPPPPGVPDLEATPGAHDGRPLTVRERMEQHRKDPNCSSCHRMMDPIGLALEHFDVTGQWRMRDNGAPIDSRGELWDGTAVETPTDLRHALLKRRESLLRTFTRNLMAYAIGRRVEYYDMPSVRTIVRTAAAKDDRISSYIMGIVNSPAFRMQKAELTEGKQ
jgi:cytochrome c5